MLSPDQLPPDWRESYEERAAIMEADGGLSFHEANRLALVDTVQRMQRAGIDLDSLTKGL